MTQVEIENLQELIGKSLGADKSVIGTETSPLVAPGENFCSSMLKLDIKLKNKDGTTEVVRTVGKLFPQNEFKNAPPAKINFIGETAYYNSIVPTLQDFVRKQGLEDLTDFCPKIYGARLNLDGKSAEVDDNAVLVMEYLEDYTTIDRTVGFDLETTKIILKNLAAFHAVPLALKIKEPEIFAKNIKPYCFDHVGPKPNDKKDRPNPDAAFIEVLKECDKCIPLLDKVKEAFPKWHDNFAPREPFATLVHRDMWTNNIMLRYENGKIIRCKFVDFQMVHYKSPATDLFFFLWTSVKKSVLEKSLDELIKFYFEHFVTILEKLECDTTPFKLDKFLEEMRITGRTEFGHALIMMLMVVYGRKGSNDADMKPGPPNGKDLLKHLSTEAKEKAYYMTLECDKRGWL